MAVKKRKRESWKQYLAKVDTPRKKILRRVSFCVFALFYVLLVAGLVMLGSAFMDYCGESFIMYENSQLSYAVDDVMAQLNGASAEQLRELLPAAQPEGTEFDDPDAVYSAGYAVLESAELTCREVRGIDPASHNYDLYRGTEKIGNFFLSAAAEETRLGLLTITQWQYAGGEVQFVYDSISHSWRVPQGFTVEVNGTVLGEKYITAGPDEIDTFEYVGKYVDMPGMVTYTVSGLLEEPQVTIFDNNGNEVAFEQVENVELAESYMSSEIPQELETVAVDTAKLWANYSLRDATIEEIRAVLIDGSLLSEQVEASNRDRRYIDKHELIGYENEKVVEFISYGDDCFACRVYLERTVKVESTQKYVSDNIDNIFYFVRLDLTDDGIDNPQWYIADMFVA